MHGAAHVPVPDHWLGYKAVAAVTGHGPSHGGAGQWPSPSSPLFCKFHRALTFRHHSADTTHHLCQPAYIKDTSRNISSHQCGTKPVWRQTSVPSTPCSAPSPCCGATDVCSYVCTASEGASWCSLLCHLSGLLGALVSPITAYISAICGRRDRYEQLRNFPITPLLAGNLTLVICILVATH